MDNTVEYYEKNAKEYYDTTVLVDMDAIYRPFLKHLSPGAKILDAGCGSGRDSRFFKDRGYRVTAFDASKEMVELSSQLLGQKVLLMRFGELNLSANYDGIWACASLLHVERKELTRVIKSLTHYSKPGGVFYMSFKHGNTEIRKDGRYFNYLDEIAFRRLVSEVSNLQLDSVSVSRDARKDRKDERWLNVYLTKV